MKHTLIGILLLMWANHYDSADGQLARLTGQKTQWGRMLDGFAGDIWFFTIYAAICLRLMDQPMPFHIGDGMSIGGFLFGVLAAFSGTVCHSKQCTLADYYRNIHLYFLKGKNGVSWIISNNSVRSSIVYLGEEISGGKLFCILW